MSYKDKISNFIEANWSMGRNDVIEGACIWAEEADKEMDAKDKDLESVFSISEEWRGTTKRLELRLEAKDKLITELNNENSLFRKLLEQSGLICNINGVESVWIDYTFWKPVNELLTNTADKDE